MSNQTLHISDSAKSRIKLMREKKNDQSLNLRITVNGGGCAGYEIELSFDSTVAAEDTVFENSVVTDEISLDLIKDSKIDFVTSTMGEEFKVLNPNAVSQCGCGTSFSL